MTRSTEHRSEVSPADPETGGLKRRPLLRALGAGAAVSIGGTAAASAGDGGADDGGYGDEEEGTDEGGETDEGDAGADRIDPVFGYPTADAGSLPEDLEPDHEVRLLNAPPAPDQPLLLYFDPAGLRVDPGDVVQFTFLSPDHTVTAFHPDIGLPPRVPEGAEPFSSPVMGPGAAWLYRFEHEGVYDIYCAPHLDYGMVMRVVVGDLAEGDVPDYAETAEGLPSREDAAEGLNQASEENEGCVWPNLMPADVLGSDALDPANVRDAGAVPFEDVVAELGYDLPEEEPGEEDSGEADTPTVRVGSHPDHGEILVGPEGMTLYVFDGDSQGAGESTCYDDCADAWPPLTVEDEPVAGDGVTADLATFERETGEIQVTANGWPLYYFARDEQPGDVEGQGVNDVWWVLDPDGTPIRTGSGE